MEQNNPKNNHPENAATQKSKKQDKQKTEKLLVVSHHCRNCDTPLTLDNRFCPNCGAKRMYNRLTGRVLFEDFTDRFLNIENSFIKTFLALFTKPEDVINGYIGGTRKRYMTAFGYFTVALTVTSVYTFLFKNWFLDASMADSLRLGAGSEVQLDITKSTTDMVGKILDYQGLLSFLNVPFYALVSVLVFWNYRKKLNFVEHMVVHLYAYSQVQIITSVFAMLFIWSRPAQMVVGFATAILPLFYTAYVFYKILGLTLEKIVLKTLLFMVIAGPIALLFFGVLGYVAYSLGMFDEFIELIKQQAEIQKTTNATARAVKDSISANSVRAVIDTVKDSITSGSIQRDTLPQ